MSSTSSRRSSAWSLAVVRALALRLAVVVGLAGGLAPMRPLAAQLAGGSGTPAWLRARLDARLDARTRGAVQHVIDSALAVGIPAEPLVDKALEGASKHASGEAIVRAVRGLAGDLATARQLLGASSLSQELNAGASALRAGVGDDALRRLRHDRPGQPLVIALSVLTDLVARGVPADNAAQSVLALTEAGIADEQLVAFRRDVERDIGIGAPPSTAVFLRANSLTLLLSRAPGAAAGAGMPGAPMANGGGRRRP